MQVSGDSTLIITPLNKKILIDGGGKEENDDVGEQILLPYLLNRKIKTIDYVIISHFDSDNCRGVFTIIKELKVKNIIISEQKENSENYEEFKKIKKNKNIKIITVKKGDKIKIEENLQFNILWPEEIKISENILNNNSIVAKLEYYNFSVLFTGDIENVAEERIIELYKNTNILKSNILKVAHHGSKTSTAENFINLVTPRIALIGVGQNNTFGHPNSSVIKRLNKYKCEIFRTDTDGEISIFVNKKGKIKISTHIK